MSSVSSLVIFVCRILLYSRFIFFNKFSAFRVELSIDKNLEDCSDIIDSESIASTFNLIKD